LWALAAMAGLRPILGRAAAIHVLPNTCRLAVGMVVRIRLRL